MDFVESASLIRLEQFWSFALQAIPNKNFHKILEVNDLLEFFFFGQHQLKLKITWFLIALMVPTLHMWKTFKKYINKKIKIIIHF